MGDPANYIEPFAGSLAVLLARPSTPRIETVNDLDGLLSNFWRAIRWAPESVAEHLDWPVNEVDLRARHRWLIENRTRITEALDVDPEFFDARAAGWWCWGLSCWIGDGWCASLTRKLPNLDGHGGKGVVAASRGDLRGWMVALRDRMREVRVACGDWTRVLTSTVTRASGSGFTGVFLDPPYAEGSMDYAAGGTGTSLSANVRAWAEEHGNDRRFRIVIAGYEGEHAALESCGWRCEAWKTKGGYSGMDGENGNASRERLWLSPHCLKGAQPSLFDVMGGSR
jgi:hypothetical protein